MVETAQTDRPIEEEQAATDLASCSSVAGVFGERYRYSSQHVQYMCEGARGTGHTVGADQDRWGHAPSWLGVASVEPEPLVPRLPWHLKFWFAVGGDF